MKRISKPFLKFSIFSGLILLALEVSAQNGTIVSGQDPNRRVIVTAVPFLNFAPDSRHSAMGDAGVATSPDVFSAHWNAGKLAFIDTDMGVSLSYSPWLGRLVNDMSLSYMTFYKRIDDKSTWGFDLRYFNMGDIQLTDGRGNELGEFTPRDIAIGGSYSRKLSEKLGLGISARFIHSNLSGNISSVGGQESRPGVTIGTDVGLYYSTEVLSGNKTGIFSWGLSINNIGPKITYNSADDLDFIPTNLRLGTAYQINLNELSSLTFTIDLNKLMVPSPPVLARDESTGILLTDDNGDFIIERGRDPNRPLINGMISSFWDAPDGFSEEMQEVMVSFGAEYIYNQVFALRTGYFYENPNKGGRRYFTMGFGIDYNKLGFDFSYLVPQVQNHPLAETLRLSLTYTIAGRE